MVPNVRSCRKSRGPTLFLFQTPYDSERVATFAGADESAPFHRFDGVAIGRQGAHFFIIFQSPQNWVAAERISFKLDPSWICESRSCSPSVSFGETLAALATFFFAIVHVHSRSD